MDADDHVTRLSRRRQTRATRCVCVTPIVLYTTVDAQCDKLTTVVGRTELTTLATVDVPWRDFSKSGVWDKVPEGSTHSFEDTRIPLQYSAG